MGNFLYGIDFGTTNSALSIYDEQKGEIIKTISILSVLYFSSVNRPNGSLKYLVGNEAVTEYVEEGMDGRFMKSIKRILPRSNFTETRINGHKLTASDLVTLILKKLKSQADEIIGYDCQKAVIGRPVFFDDDDSSKDELAQERLKKAAERAGLTNVVFQFEPIGAAFAYERNIKNKEKVLVADLGGGTTDFTVIELDPAKAGKADRRKDILATGGIYIGGDSFDSAFMWEKGTPYFGRGVLYESMPGKMLDLPVSIFTNICSWEKMNFFNSLKVKEELKKYYFLSKNNARVKNMITLTTQNLGYAVFREIEKTKISLSDSDQAVFCFDEMDIKIEENTSLSEYRQIIEKDLQRIENYLDRFLSDNNIHPDDISSLFLTGGTSLVQAIQALFHKKFPHIPITSGDNFISVAKGLAYSGYLFSDE